MLAAQAAGADLAYVGSPFIATEEANASDATSRRSSRRRGRHRLQRPVHRHSRQLSALVDRRAGLDPDALAAGNLETMKFGSDGSSKAKAWRDIWGSGQGIGAVDKVRPAAELMDLLAEQYVAAKGRICGAAS